MLKLAYQIYLLAAPIVLSNISVPLLGLVDTAVMGHLASADYLAAVTLGASVLSFVFWGFSFLRMGITGVTAQAVGQRNFAQVVQTLQQGVLLAAVIALLLLAAQIPLLKIGLKLIGGEPAVQQLALDYAQVRIWSAPAVLINYVLLGWFLAQQNSRFTLLMLVLGNSLNMLLDLWFVLGLGWQVKGVALASVIADYCTLTLGLWLTQKQLVRWGLPLGRNLIRWTSYKRLMQVNQQLLVRTWALLLVMAIFTAQGAKFGADSLAANAILMQLVLFASFALDGFAHAAEALVGQSVGAKSRAHLKQVVIVSALWSLLLTVLLVLVYGFFGSAILGLLTSLASVTDLALQHLPWVCIAILFAAVSYLLDGVYVGLTRTDIMRNSVLLGLLAYLIIDQLNDSFGLSGLWLAFCGFMAVRSLVLLGHFMYWIKRTE